MSKERLEEINQRIMDMKRKSGMPTEVLTWEGWQSILPIFTKDLEYLQEQAERVQELEEENKRIRQMKYHEAYEQGKFDTNMKVWYEIPKLEQQNKRYREVVTQAISDLENECLWDALVKLKALEGEE